MKKKDILFGLLIVSGLGLVITGAIVTPLLPVFVPVGSSLLAAGIGMMSKTPKVCEDDDVKSENSDSIMDNEEISRLGVQNALENPQLDELPSIFYHFRYSEDCEEYGYEPDVQIDEGYFNHSDVHHNDDDEKRQSSKKSNVGFRIRKHI